MAGAAINIGPDIDDMFNEYRQTSFNCWTVVQVDYELINPNDQAHTGFDAYLIATPIRIFKLIGIINVWENLYKDEFGIVAERIKEVNAEFIKDKSGFTLTGIKQLFLKISIYQPLKVQSWKPLLKFIKIIRQ